MSFATTPRRRRHFSLFNPIARRKARVASLPSPPHMGRRAFKPLTAHQGGGRFAVLATSRCGVGQVLVEADQPLPTDYRTRISPRKGLDPPIRGAATLCVHPAHV